MVAQTSIALLTMNFLQLNAQTSKTSSAIRLQLQQSLEEMTVSNVWAESESGHTESYCNDVCQHIIVTLSRCVTVRVGMLVFHS